MILFSKLQKIRFKLFLLAAAFIINNTAVNAQKKVEVNNLNVWADESWVVDGSAKDWPVSNWNSNKSSKISYAIANNGTHLYFIIKSTDQADLRRLLRGGIRLAINGKAEKKIKQQITFPIFSARSVRPKETAGKTPNNHVADINHELAQLNAIEIGGFDQLPDGMIARINEFEITAAARLDENGFLICEYSVPMKLLQIDAAENDIFAVQIRVNGLQTRTTVQNRNLNAPMGWNGRSNTFPQRLPGTEGLEPTEFWILSRLAPNPNTR